MLKAMSEFIVGWLVFLTPHKHKWHIIEQIDFRKSNGVHSYGTRYYLRCECCGKVKKQDFKNGNFLS